ncbi:MAG: hypothetical protein GEU28_00510 [Dehalococcoidia bacterium]|nr:hypothetical protein [Dehalococcoidia bacterium]
MDFYEVMRTASTTRYFRPDPVPDDVIYRVLDNARFAPSGGNRQGWRVVVVKDAETRKKLAGMYMEVWEPYEEQIRAAATTQQRQRAIDRTSEFARSVDQIPVHLLVCADLSTLLVTDAELSRQSIVGGASVYTFVQNIILACRNEGLGIALTTLLCRIEDQVEELLGMPDGVGLAAFMPLGYPDPERLVTKTSRRPVEEFAFRESFGGQPLGVSS